MNEIEFATDILNELVRRGAIDASFDEETAIQVIKEMLINYGIII